MFAKLASGIGTAILLLQISAAGCTEPADPCESFERFAAAMEERCGELQWDCEAIYPTLGPERQQDLDWCMDCARAQEDSSALQRCETAPLSGEPCPSLLAQILDASCLEEP
ncbi:MAG: hypothetical protein RBU30_19075 [Polyangia bacterium]|jgi:hypothetical protein|nr:hypothetical protein [Polyangia bacterium]